jgi:hypothetical protein
MKLTGPLKDFLAFVSKVFIFAITFYALTLVFLDGGPFEQMLGYLSILLTLFTALVYLIDIFLKAFRKPDRFFLNLVKQQLLVFWILVSSVYTFVLLPYLNDVDLFGSISPLPNLLIHYLIPFTVLMDYLIFAYKGKFTKFYLVINYLPLILYVLAIYVYRAQGGLFYLAGNTYEYPYFFMNPNRIGWLNVMFVFFGIFVVTGVITWSVINVDQILGTQLSSLKNKRK